MRTKLLIDEPPLQVQASLAVLIGLNEAIALQQLHYWMTNPKCLGEVDPAGNKWIYNSYEEWQQKNFPFWSTKTIQRTFLSLEKMDLVFSAQLYASKRDMRKFYRPNYRQIEAMEQDNLSSSNQVILSSSTTPMSPAVLLTETTAETTTETSRPAVYEWLAGEFAKRIGLIPNMIVLQELQEAARLPREWLEFSFAQLDEANQRQPIRQKWSYVKAILKTCEQHNGIPTPANKATKKGAASAMDANAAYAREMGWTGD